VLEHPSLDPVTLSSNGGAARNAVAREVLAMLPSGVLQVSPTACFHLGHFPCPSRSWVGPPSLNRGYAEGYALYSNCTYGVLTRMMYVE
jgi:hypothetical protein